MAQYSLSTSTIQRSKGSSAVAHAAYISGAFLMDARTGREADYTRRSGVEYASPAIVVPDGEPSIDRAQLWDMAEAAELRKDGTPGRKIRVSLPHEVGAETRLEMSLDYAKWLTRRFHVAVDFAVHEPDKEGDQRNFHTHFVLTTREYRNGELREKAQLEWKGSKLKEQGLPSGIAMMHEIRQRWEYTENNYLIGHDPKIPKVSCKRLSVQKEAALNRADQWVKQGREEQAEAARLKAVELSRTPQQHVGWKATAMERGLAAQKKRLAAQGRSIEHLPAFATERGEERHRAQEMARWVRTECRKIWEMSKAAARALMQKPTQQPATPKPEIKPIPQPVPKPEPTRAEKTHRFLKDLAKDFETKGSALLTEEQAYLAMDALFPPRDWKTMYGKGPGKRLVATYQQGLPLHEHRCVPLKSGLAELVIEHTEKGVVYTMKPGGGREKDLGRLIRDEADNEQHRRDTYVLEKRQRRVETPRRELNRGPEIGD